MEMVTEATNHLSMKLTKSVKSYKREAGRCARSITEVLDIEDFLKSIDKVANPERHARRRSSIIHPPIDSSKFPPSAMKDFPKSFSKILDEQSDEEEERRCEDRRRKIGSVYKDVNDLSKLPKSYLQNKGTIKRKSDES